MQVYSDDEVAFVAAQSAKSGKLPPRTFLVQLDASQSRLLRQRLKKPRRVKLAKDRRKALLDILAAM